LTKDDYWNRHYRLSANEWSDTLTVSKHGGTDWSEVAMNINDVTRDSITLRSKEMAEQLHFMLGQLLGKT
jgi:hypothetical protein